jgi:hypothetical protein
MSVGYTDKSVGSTVEAHLPGNTPVRPSQTSSRVSVSGAAPDTVGRDAMPISTTSRVGRPKILALPGPGQQEREDLQRFPAECARQARVRDTNQASKIVSKVRSNVLTESPGASLDSEGSMQRSQ